MADLPTGTVTFLLTDIEGSTKLWEEQAQAMEAALARHDALAAATIAQHDGTLVKSRGEGDSLFAVFSQAAAAAAAACALQRALHAEPWAPQTPLRVRIALHTGESALRNGDYFGATVNRCARLRGAAHGGQVLLSEATREQVRGTLPPGVSLKDLGLHWLRDLAEPERIYQVQHRDLPEVDAPLRSLQAFSHNLPVQLTSFVGREREMAEVKRLLATTRLLTLTGSGGTGKTRLALQVAADVLEEDEDGAWLVELAPLSDPSLVPQAVATALGVKEEPGKPLTQTLVEYLKPRHLRLLLDNCEHLLTACAELADALLRACPSLRLLASSREALGIAGERTYRVPSLTLPELRHLPPAERLTEYEAVRLFVDRAVFTQPGFAVTEQNAPAVVSVCHRLDGIPLAIELAAARVRAMPVEQIDQRLDQRFRLLTGGSRTALPRQQTLRSLIDWSYDLLNETERALLRRLSIFSGGWTLEAAEGVCAGGGVEEWEVLDLLASLVEKSLVLYEEALPTRAPGGEAHYRLLETVRQYARDRLLEAGEAEAVRGRHLDWFLALAEQARPELFGPEQRAWLDRLEVEHDNLRAALAWSEAQERGTTGLRLGAALWRFWSVRGYLAEGCERLGSVLSHPGASAPTLERARALDGAGLLAMNCGDFTRACTLYEEALAIGQELGDRQVIATTCNSLGDARRFQGDVRAARSLYEEALRLGREVDDQWSVAYSLTALGIMVATEGNCAAARSLLEEGLAIKRALGDQRSIAYSVSHLAKLALAEENARAARSLYEESLTISQGLGDKRGIAWSLSNLGLVARAQGDLMAARARFAESLAIFLEVRDKRSLADNLEIVAEVAAAQGEPELAARFFGSVQRLREAMGTPLPPADGAEHDCPAASLRTVLGKGAFEAAWAEGWAMSLEEAVACAMEATPAGEG